VIRGINYPWTVYEGRANYGCDFGRNKWNSHTGVTAHPSEVAADFDAMRRAGVEVARWFVLTDGRSGLRWKDNGEIAGFDEEFFDDMDAALEIAAAAGIRLCLVLIDFLWFDDPQRRLALLDRDDVSAFLDRVIDPFIDRYGASPAIHSLDLINEPDWIIMELATDRHRAGWPLERLRMLCGMMTRRIRAASRLPLTIGGGRVSAIGEWDRDVYDLDFLQVHTYPDVRHASREDAVFGTPVRDLNVRRPILIGEFPSDPRIHPAGHLSPAYTMADYLAMAKRGGYLGAWPWSFKGTDAFGAVDLTQLRSCW
jgi:hypothetical protein